MTFIMNKLEKRSTSILIDLIWPSLVWPGLLFFTLFTSDMVDWWIISTSIFSSFQEVHSWPQKLRADRMRIIIILSPRRRHHHASLSHLSLLPLPLTEHSDGSQSSIILGSAAQRSKCFRSTLNRTFSSSYYTKSSACTKLPALPCNKVSNGRILPYISCPTSCLSCMPRGGKVKRKEDS